MDNIGDHIVFNLPNEPFETVYNHARIEPEVWIEFSRTNHGFSVNEVIGMLPEGLTIRYRYSEDTGEQIWEYLM